MTLLLLACNGTPQDTERPADTEPATDDTQDSSGETGGETAQETGLEPVDPILEGDAQAPALDALPDIEVADETDTARITETPLAIVADRVLLAVDETATVGDVNALAQDLRAELTGTLPDLGLLVLEPVEPSDDGLRWSLDAMDAALETPGVVAASVDTVMVDSGLPPYATWDNLWKWTSPQAQNRAWGLDAIGAPPAWNLIPALRRNSAHVPNVFVFDSGFQTHADLSTANGTHGNDAVHGLKVGGVIAATWDNTGYSGVFPAHAQLPLQIQDVLVRNLYETENLCSTQMSFYKKLNAALAVSVTSGKPVIINHSHGFPYLFSEGDTFDGTLYHQVDPYKEFDVFKGYSHAELVAYTGGLYNAVAAAWDKGGASDWLFICTTGNYRVDEARQWAWKQDGIDVDITDPLGKTASGCAWSAAMDGSSTNHFISVENLATPDRLNTRSSRGGTLAAPGSHIGLLTGSNSYGEGSGTSFSAPMVAGAAALLWTWFPDATASQIRAALVDSGKSPLESNSGPRLDLLAALDSLDAVAGSPDLRQQLADVDDDTADGSLRAGPGTGMAQPDVALWDRGDGCVDMADFRAWRDARVDILSGGSALSGTVKRDHNGDGESNQWTDAGPTEAMWSRYDFNGDAEYDVDDLKVMQDAWGTCDSDRTSDPAVTEEYDAADLPDLLTSHDVWLPEDVGSGAVSVAFPHGTVTLTAAQASARQVTDVRSTYVIFTVKAGQCAAGQSVTVTWSGDSFTYACPMAASVSTASDNTLTPVREF